MTMLRVAEQAPGAERVHWEVCVCVSGALSKL